ncbi:MAG: hypothetical protein R2911_44485 [Caldilineaceae bacterium]
MYLLGADRLGCDLLSLIYGTRISMTIGLVGVALSFVLASCWAASPAFMAGPSTTDPAHHRVYPLDPQRRFGCAGRRRAVGLVAAAHLFYDHHHPLLIGWTGLA